ncbi:MAG: SDR family NAD(P)-dependent oxidoreductase [Rubrivivax sp.]
MTGGAQGIGLAIAERFLASGARVVLWDIDEARLAERGGARQGRAGARRHLHRGVDRRRLGGRGNGAHARGHGRAHRHPRQQRRHHRRQRHHVGTRPRGVGGARWK